jgi:hypothetical protein
VSYVTLANQCRQLAKSVMYVLVNTLALSVNYLMTKTRINIIAMDVEYAGLVVETDSFTVLNAICAYLLNFKMAIR